MTICLGLTAGCSTTARVARIGWFSKFGKGPKTAEEIADSPFKRSSKSIGKSSVSEASETNTTEADDAELIALIDRELPDASPADRLALFRDLKAAGPENAALLMRTAQSINRGSQNGGLAQSDRRGDRENSNNLYPNDNRVSLLSQTGDNRDRPLSNTSPWEDDVRQADRTGRSTFTNSMGRPPSSPGSANQFGHSDAHDPRRSGIQGDPSQTSFGANDPRSPGFGNRIQRTAGTSSGMGPRSVSPVSSGPNGTTSLPVGGLGGLRQPSLASDTSPNRTMGSQFETNDPLAVPTGGIRSDHGLQTLIAEAEAEIGRRETATTPEEKQRLIEQHVHLRMLYLMAGQQDRALVAIPGVEPSDQEFWQQTFWAFNNYFDVQNIPDEADRASQTIAQLSSAVQRLREKAQLELRNVTFTHKISSFGNFEKFQRDEFTPGQPVLVYAEVDNFSSEPSADGQYRTILKATIEVYKTGPNGDLVEKFSFDPEEDLCRRRRQDYFHSYEFTIPQRIGLGPHVLKLIVEDQLSRKIATYSLNFTVR
jgi:hypothetical protein